MRPPPVCLARTLAPGRTGARQLGTADDVSQPVEWGHFALGPKCAPASGATSGRRRAAPSGVQLLQSRILLRLARAQLAPVRFSFVWRRPRACWLPAAGSPRAYRGPSVTGPTGARPSEATGPVAPPSWPEPASDGRAPAAVPIVSAIGAARHHRQSLRPHCGPA